MDHKFVKHEDGCPVKEGLCDYCDGGLASCEICKGAESTLPTECPGEAMTEKQYRRVGAGVLDFWQGRWVSMITLKNDVAQLTMTCELNAKITGELVRERDLYHLRRQEASNSCETWRRRFQDLVEYLRSYRDAISREFTDQSLGEELEKIVQGSSTFSNRQYEEED